MINRTPIEGRDERLAADRRPALGTGTCAARSRERRPRARSTSLAAFVAAGGSVPEAAVRVGIRPSTAKRHLADLRARSGPTTEQLIYAGRAGGLAVPTLEG